MPFIRQFFIFTYGKAWCKIKNTILEHLWVQFSSVIQSGPTLCDPMDCSTPGFPVHPQLPELAQTHVHWVNDAIQPSHPLSSPSPKCLVNYYFKIPDIGYFVLELTTWQKLRYIHTFSFKFCKKTKEKWLCHLQKGKNGIQIREVAHRRSRKLWMVKPGLKLSSIWLQICALTRSNFKRPVLSHYIVFKVTVF